MNTLEKEFVPYELAVKLKELGFDEPCMYAWCITPKHRVQYEGKECLRTDGNPFGSFFAGKNWNVSYNPNKNKIQCSAPTFSQAFRWFREKYEVVGIVNFGTNDFTFNVYNSDGLGLLIKESLTFNGTYEEAELACLTKLIELLKEYENKL